MSENVDAPRVRGRRAPNLDEPGLAEALAAYMRLMDEVVTESQHCTRVENHEAIAVYGDIIQRAAAREREREQQAPESP